MGRPNPDSENCSLMRTRNSSRCHEEAPSVRAAGVELQTPALGLKGTPWSQSGSRIHSDNRTTTTSSYADPTLNSYDSSMTTSSLTCSPSIGRPISAMRLSSCSFLVRPASPSSERPRDNGGDHGVITWTDNSWT